MSFNKLFFWLGTWMLSGEGFGPQDLRESESVIRLAIEQGITQFDTAPVYGRGNSDKLLSKFSTNDIIISSKTGLGWNNKTYFHDGSAKFIIQDVELSLKRLKRDVIDIMYLHWPDKNTPILESLAAIDKLKQQGKVKHIGGCNLSIEDLTKIMTNIPIDYIQLKHSLLDSDKTIKLIKKKWPKLQILIYSIFEQGLLLNPDIKLSTSDQRNKNPIFSTTNREKIKQNPLFSTKDSAMNTVMDWLSTLNRSVDDGSSRPISGSILGARNTTQLSYFMHHI